MGHCACDVTVLRQVVQGSIDKQEISQLISAFDLLRLGTLSTVYNKTYNLISNDTMMGYLYISTNSDNFMPRLLYKTNGT